MNKGIEKCVDRMKEIFPRSHVYGGDELIVEPKNNIYFRIDNIENALEFKCKVVEYLSRPAHKGPSKWWQSRIRAGMNKFLGTKFTPEELSTIYTYLGGCCNREKTKSFILSGYDVSTLS